MNNRYALLLAVFLTACSAADDGQSEPDDMACIAWPAPRMLGTALHDQLLDVVIDPHGGVYLAGYQNASPATSGIEPGGQARGVVLKYSRGGERLSQLMLNTTGASSVEALAYQPHSGELLLAGRTSGALPGYINQGQFDTLLGWMHEDAGLLQLAQFGDQRPQHPRRLALGWNDELLIAGFEDIYVPTNYVETWEDPMLMKLARVGHQLVAVWQQPFNTPQPDAISGLAVASTTDGAIYVTGHNESGAERGMFVRRYDSQGMLIWHSQQTGIGYDNGVALHILPDGNLLLAGSSYAQLGPVAHGMMDILVRKLDAASGQPLWTGQYGSSEIDWVTDMAVDAAGRIYLVGETMGSLEPNRANPDGNAVFLVKLDPQGRLLMAKQWNSSGFDSATAVAVDTCERVVIVGHTTGNLVGPSAGGQDGFVIPVDTRGQVSSW